jgi:hypothetical protein
VGGRAPAKARDAVHHVDPAAVRIGQPHHLAAAGLVERRHRAAGRRGERAQVGRARGVEREAEKCRLAHVGDVHVVLRVGAAHVERVRGACRAVHAEVGEERLHPVQVRGPEAREGDVGHADDRVRHGSRS